MRVRNFTGLVRAVLAIYKHFLYYDKCRLIGNDQDLRNVFLEFSMRVRNFEWLVRAILAIYKQPLY